MSLPKYIPVMKGNATAFTCLGNWYDTADPSSIKSMFEILGQVGKRDYATGISEYLSAVYDLPEDLCY